MSDVHLDGVSRQTHRAATVLNIETEDGLVHEIWRPETEAMYGKTWCNTSFTADPAHVHEIRARHFGVGLVVRRTRATVTCLRCVGSSRHEDDVQG